jgi:hypothetical protein
MHAGRNLERAGGGGQFGFSVAAVEGKHCLPDCRLLIQQIPALIERRYSKVTHYPPDQAEALIELEVLLLSAAT